MYYFLSLAFPALDFSQKHEL